MTRLVHAEGVHRRFGTREVLVDVTLEVPAGHIVGLLGPSGAGKTTLVKMIAGADVPDRGQVHVTGRKMPAFDVLAAVGYMAQSDALYLELTGRENLEFFGSLYALRGSRLRARCDASAAMVGLLSDLDRPVMQYSGGMKRRLSLAVAMLHEPKVLILDEPTVGIDPVLRRSIWAELRKHAEGGAAILVTTHVMDEAERCDSVCMIRDGKIIAHGAPDELKRSTNTHSVEDAFLAFAAA